MSYVTLNFAGGPGGTLQSEHLIHSVPLCVKLAIHCASCGFAVLFRQQKIRLLGESRKILRKKRLNDH